MLPFGPTDPHRRPQGWEILNIAGVPFYVTPSFLIFAGFILLMHLDLEGGGGLLQGGLMVFIVFFSLLAHEAGHAFMARLMGVRTVQVALVALGGLTSHPRTTRPRELAIVLAGPLATTLLIAGFFVLGQMPFTDANPGARMVFLQFVFINVLWLLYNLLPIYPLDGGQTVHLLLSFVTGERTARMQTAWLSLVTCVAAALLIYRFLGGFFFAYIILLMLFLENLAVVRGERH